MCNVTSACMTHWYVWHDAFIYVTWLLHMYDMTSWYVWHDSFIRVTWLTHMWHIWCTAMRIAKTGHSHSHVWHDSFICVQWLIHTWHNSFIAMPLAKSGHSCSYVRHDALIRDKTLIHMQKSHAPCESGSYATYLSQNILSFIGLFCRMSSLL